MADSVTISTFLELRDHMSGGVNRVVEELKKLNRTASEMNDKMRAAGKEHERFRVTAVSNAKASTTALEGLKNVASSLASPLLAAASAIGGFAALKGAIKLGQDFEDVSLRIAGTIKAFDLAPTFNIATKQAESVIGTIQKLAAALPGETEDYITVFAQALPKSIAAGMSDVRKVADFTSRYTAVAISNTVDAQQAGMDLFRMLAGQAGADVRMWTVLAEKIGMDAKEFNKLAASVRQSKIDTAIKAFDDQLKAAGNTFSAKFGEMQSNLKEIVRLGTAPLFVGVKGVLTDINKYLSDNRVQLTTTVQQIARDFLDLVKRLPSVISEIGDKLDEIWGYTKLFVGVWAGAQLINGLSSVLTLYKQIRDVAIAIQAANVFGGAAGAAGGAGATAAGAGSRALIGAGAAAIMAGVGAFFYSKPAGESELDWEKARKAAQAQELEIRQKYGDILTLMEERTAGIPKSMVDVTGTLAGIYTDLTQKMKAPLSEKGVAEVASQRERLVDYASILGIDVSDLIPAPKIREAAKPPINDFRYSRFDIRQEFAEGFDPDRIAAAFATDLGKLADHKLRAASPMPAGAH